LSALPYLLSILFSIPSAWLADYLTNNKIAQRGVIRKSFALLSFLGPGFCLIGLSFTGCNQTMSVVWVCLSGMFTGANNSGVNVSSYFQISII